MAYATYVDVTEADGVDDDYDEEYGVCFIVELS